MVKIVSLFIGTFVIALLSINVNSVELKKVEVESNGHTMILWKKQPDATQVKPSDVSKQILLLHGRTWSSLPDFDLQVEGEQVSVMDKLVALGFTVWALDARGYGQTQRDSSGWNNPNKAANDVANVVRWITNETTRKPVVFGWSYGSMVAQLMVQQNPQLASAAILYGYPIDPEKKVTEPKMPKVVPKNANTAKNAASDFITPGSISQKAIDIYVTESLRADPYRADWNKLSEWNQLDGSRVTVPLLLIQAEFDPLAESESHARFFVKVANANKQWVVLAGGDHAALLETPKDRLVHSVNDFVEWLEK
ncbi:MAG: lysophospholipase [Kangiellaceae bacterium]|nr:lysophospholipase [Kangiellaceae bacterium]